MHLEPADHVVKQLARLTPLLNEVGSMLFSGGDTARLICQWLCPDALEIRGEIVPGLAWGVMQGGRADQRLMCTKPGGFGDASCLVEAVEFLGRAGVRGEGRPAKRLRK